MTWLGDWLRSWQLTAAEASRPDPSEAPHHAGQQFISFDEMTDADWQAVRAQHGPRTPQSAPLFGAPNPDQFPMPGNGE